MFKKKPSISPPFNFEHRVHTNFNAEEGRYEGLPVQVRHLVVTFLDFFVKLAWIF